MSALTVNRKGHFWVLRQNEHFNIMFDPFIPKFYISPCCYCVMKPHSNQTFSEPKPCPTVHSLICNYHVHTQHLHIPFPFFFLFYASHSFSVAVTPYVLLTVCVSNLSRDFIISYHNKKKCCFLFSLAHLFAKQKYVKL